MRRSISTILLFACISQKLCEVSWNSPTDGDTITVQEDENAGFVVASFDATASGAITYGVVSETPAENKFGIQNSNELYLKSTLDYESVQNYTVVIKAQDTTSDDQADITLYVTVKDVNDEVPVITSATSVNIPTNTALGAVVYTMTSDDPDTIGTVTYSIISGNDNSDFSIIASTGGIILEKSLDINVTPEYDFVIGATDGVQVVTHRVTFYLTNVIWQTPQEGQMDSMPEDTAESTVIISLQAENGLFFYFTVEPDDERSKFRIRNSILRLEQSLDYETTKSYTFNITASDGDATADITYILNITDVNDEPPEFARETDTIDLSRETDTGEVVYTAEATDQDTVGSLSYAIKSGNIGTTFSINIVTGEVTLEANLDPDTTPSYGLVIEVSDGVATAEMVLIITVNKIVWTDPAKGIPEDIPEDTAVNSVIKNLAADTAVSYIIVSQSPTRDKFDIININQLVLRSELDYETLTSYIISLRAVNSDGNIADIIFILNIADVNDVAPVFVSGTSVFIPENTAVGTLLHEASATDKDTVGTITYSITGGNDNNEFSITASAGTIFLQRTLSTDVTPAYNLIISAADGVHIVHQAVTFYVTNVIYQTPQNGQTDSIPEDTAASTVIISLQAENALFFTFTVEPDDERSKFRIRNTRDLRLEQALDYESTKSYTFSIKAIGSEYTADVTYILNITDVNDEPPVFATETDTKDLSRETDTGEIVYTAVATDQDTVGSPSYSIKSGNTGSTFSIGTTTGDVILDVGLDPDITPSYILVIEVSDGVATAQMTLTITVNKTFSSANATLCESNCLPSPDNSSEICNVTSGECLFGCVDGFDGPTCSIKCPEKCALSQDKVNETCDLESGECLHGCQDGFYGTNCTQRCSDLDNYCKRCSLNGAENRIECTECHRNFYRENGKCLQCNFWCTSNQSSSLPACRENDGYCNHGCKAGRYGFKCGARCSVTCSETCHRDTGTCIEGCASTSYCGSTCQIPCQDGCVSQHCNQSCDCANGCNANYWGDRCQNLCGQNCNKSDDAGVAICDNTEGTCNFGCNDNKFWDSQCDKPCQNECVKGTCMRESGNCTEGCKSSTVYGWRCDKKCNEHCIEGTCERTNGYCNKGCISGYAGIYCDVYVDTYRQKIGILKDGNNNWMGAAISGWLCFVILLVAVLIMVIRKKNIVPKGKTNKMNDEQQPTGSEPNVYLALQREHMNTNLGGTYETLQSKDSTADRSHYENSENIKMQ